MTEKCDPVLEVFMSIKQICDTWICIKIMTHLDITSKVTSNLILIQRIKLLTSFLLFQQF